MTSHSEDLSKQNLISFNADFGKRLWPFYLSVGFLQSSKDATFHYNFDYNYNLFNKYEVSTTEWKIGVKKTWNAYTNTHPYIGVELALINAEEKGSGVDNEYQGTATGDGHCFGLNGGIYWTLANHYNLGVEAGINNGSVSLGYNESVDLDGTQILLLVGYHW